jgi:hypothetical protein
MRRVRRATHAPRIVNESVEYARVRYAARAR